jgi:hypothetical protein
MHVYACTCNYDSGCMPLASLSRHSSIEFSVHSLTKESAELCAFVIDTRGSAKPAPWGHFSHAFGASDDPVTDSAIAERHAPPYLLTPNLL